MVPLVLSRMAWLAGLPPTERRRATEVQSIAREVREEWRRCSSLAAEMAFERRVTQLASPAYLGDEVLDRWHAAARRADHVAYTAAMYVFDEAKAQAEKHAQRRPCEVILFETLARAIGQAMGEAASEIHSAWAAAIAS